MNVPSSLFTDRAVNWSECASRLHGSARQIRIRAKKSLAAYDHKVAAVGNDAAGPDKMLKLFQIHEKNAGICSIVLAEKERRKKDYFALTDGLLPVHPAGHP